MDILKGIQNIIFDWGGVIINIDYHQTRNSFIELGMKDFDRHFTQLNQSHIFDGLDTGNISGEDFFRALEKEMPEGTKPEDIRDAWNAMLLDFPEENFNLLQDLKSRYRTFLFSNTNEPHLSYYFPKIKEWYGISEMDPLFEKAYYSCRLGMRKPDPEAFLHIIRENKLNAEETLFIDDSPQHIEGAKTAGLKTCHLAPPKKLKDIFDSSQEV